MLLDIAKLLFQKDTRDVVKDLIELIKKRPEWKADLLTLDEKLPYSKDAEVGLLVQFIREALLQKNWPPKRAGVAEFAIQEVVDNAFHHGRPLEGSAGTVRVSATLTSYWVSCRVTDSGEGFSLKEILAQQARDEPRGLTRVREVSSGLAQDGANTIEVTIRATPGAIDIALLDKVLVINMRGRLGRESFDIEAEFPRIEAAIESTQKVLIDLSEAEYASSVVLRFLGKVYRRNKGLGQPSVLVVKPDSAIQEILTIARYDKTFFECVGSRSEGIAKLRL
jgi:anti-sigma regulatory factor (Ser/Thr protein kinase)/anti-anti-sigma regulatory factor